MTKNLIRSQADKRAAACLAILAVIAAIAVLLFVFQGLNQNNFDFNFPRRIKKIAAMILVSVCVGYSSVVFQTMTESRILTPGVMGLDSLYLFIQSFIVYLMGAEKLMLMNSSLHFIISVGAMMAASLIIYRLVFRPEGLNIYTLVLAGMIMGTFFKGISSFLQLLIDPNEFSILQGSLFASFKNINEKLLSVSCIIVIGCLFFTKNDISRFDVLGLSKDNAISLGIYYDSLIKRTMMVISALTAVSTVLVGPVTFLGILLVSLSRELLKTYRHRYLIPGAVLLGIISLPAGQFVSERVLSGNATVSVILNFIGGIYFIFILLKESRR
nr:iron chelate uptake ABC transporter family permease subunit [uncultured Clostridium sp.]